MMLLEHFDSSCLGLQWDLWPVLGTVRYRFPPPSRVIIPGKLLICSSRLTFAEFLEVNFPLRPVAPAAPNAPLDEKLDKFPIPELEKELPKGARFERGGPRPGQTGTAGSPTVQAEGAVSLKALLKRVAADQVGM